MFAVIFPPLRNLLAYSPRFFDAAARYPDRHCTPVEHPDGLYLDYVRIFTRAVCDTHAAVNPLSMFLLQFIQDIDHADFEPRLSI